MAPARRLPKTRALLAAENWSSMFKERQWRRRAAAALKATSPFRVMLKSEYAAPPPKTSLTCRLREGRRIVLQCCGEMSQRRSPKSEWLTDFQIFPSVLEWMEKLARRPCSLGLPK